MKRHFNNIKIVTLLISFLLLVASCHKDNTSFSYDDAVETTSSYVEGQQMADLILNTYFKSITDSTLLADGTSEIDGANVSYSTDPLEISIKYAWDIPDGYGHYRKGTITATSESGFFDSLDVINLSFNSFYYDLDSVHVGSFEITNKGLSVNHNYIFDIVGSSIFRQTTDSLEVKVSHMIFNLQQEFVRHKDASSVYHTPDDYFRISGNLNGTARNGFAFSGNVNSENYLLSSYSCNWLKSGVVDVTLAEFIYDAQLNFDNGGECKNEYSIIINESLFRKAFDEKK